MKKFEQTPVTYHFDITEIGDHLQVFIHELDSTVETEPGKTAYTDALDAVHLAAELRWVQETKHATTAHQAAAQ